MKLISRLFVIVILFKISIQFDFNETIQHKIKIRSLFNQIKSFAKELIESNDHTDVGHLFVEHIEHCRYTCENDGLSIQNTNYTRTYNGCGAYNIHVDFDQLNMTGITDCCNDHDICYDTCNSEKLKCDQTFETCLLGQCAQMTDDPDKQYVDFTPMCNSAARVMFETVKLFGCVAFEKSQTESCNCIDENDA